MAKVYIRSSNQVFKQPKIITVCPVCGSKHINHSEEINFDGNHIPEYYECEECEHIEYA